MQQLTFDEFLAELNDSYELIKGRELGLFRLECQSCKSCWSFDPGPAKATAMYKSYTKGCWSCGGPYHVKGIYSL